MRLIDADELERRLKDLDSKTFCDRQQAVNACIAEVSVMPTVDAERQRTTPPTDEERISAMEDVILEMLGGSL